MTWKDDLINAAGDVLIEGAKLIAHEILERVMHGHKPTAEDVKHVANGVLDSALRNAELVAANRLAATQLDDRMREVATQIEHDFAHVFEPKPAAERTVPPLDIDIQFDDGGEGGK